MDFNVRCAIEAGMPPIQAVQMATINVAVHFGLTQEIGEVAPGRLADVVLVRDLNQMKVAMTVANGQVVAQDGALTTALPEALVPDYVRNTVHLQRVIRAEDFAISSPQPGRTIMVRLPSFSRPAGTVELPVEAGVVHADPARGVTKLAVIDRHTGRGGMGLGFARGLGPMRGALATTVGHDAHNLIVAGADDRAMALAANRAAELGGAIVVVDGEQVRAELSLPVAGLMSPRPAAAVARRLEALNRVARELGTGEWMGDAPVPIFTFLTLTAAHPLLITDHGFVDVEQGRVVSQFS
jgi:adenine deaminase